MTAICAHCRFCSKPGYEFAECRNDSISRVVPERIHHITGEITQGYTYRYYCSTNNFRGECPFWEPISPKIVVPETPKKSFWEYVRQLWTRT